MNNEIEKSEQPNPDDVLTAITSFNDPSILTSIFKELGWDYSFEIREWLQMARQNGNLAVKAKALIQLRKLLREAAESAGYTANVSQTIPNAQGGQTTFSAKRISGILNPTKQIESTIKEPQNDPETRTEPESDRGRNRRESQTPTGADTREQFPPERDTGRTDTERDAGPGKPEPPDGGEASEQRSNATDNPTKEGDGNPCIETRPPTCDPELYPGISTSAEED